MRHTLLYGTNVWYSEWPRTVLWVLQLPIAVAAPAAVRPAGQTAGRTGTPGGRAAAERNRRGRWLERSNTADTVYDRTLVKPETDPLSKAASAALPDNRAPPAVSSAGGVPLSIEDGVHDGVTPLPGLEHVLPDGPLLDHARGLHRPG